MDLQIAFTGLEHPQILNPDLSGDPSRSAPLLEASLASPMRQNPTN
jgi:hypothetical protein